tara:strand:- start:5891 stop:6502 length:612 start_codon:yes stop_codon:yes gene_type:complete
VNCDEAFDLITHPTDHNCEELQWHLQLCPRCLQMKETLAPALDTFQQVLDDATAADELADYHAEFHPSAEQVAASLFPKTGKPFLSAETVRMAEQAAGRLRAESVTNQLAKQSLKRKPHQKRLVHAALILLAGFVMGWGISLDRSENNHFSSEVSSLQSQQPCLWIAQRENRAYQPAKTEREKRAASSVVLSCVACHLRSTAE